MAFSVSSQHVERMREQSKPHAIFGLLRKYKKKLGFLVWLIYEVWIDWFTTVLISGVT
jgi:hypothetical protein